ncbi:MAG TPA: PP2C family protein-serine/threonine phosphatase [Thermoanaerobaculia bacterium]|nr:PP2C family protein-serine/threonine phosphatase [Thermoanaerobaculia bacterium]
MKRIAPIAACLLGLAGLAMLIGRFNTSQPAGIRLTRGEAQALADREALRLGIPVDRSWKTLTWANSMPLDDQLDKQPALRRRAEKDPVIGPRLGGYHATYYRRGLEKSVPYGDVVVSAQTGQIIMGRIRMRPEEPAPRLTEQEARQRADAFVRSRDLPGAPNPNFEDARPTVLRNRTDWVMRYRVPSSFPTGKVVPYLHVHFAGDRFAGWQLIEEMADGSTFRGDSSGDFIGFFARYGVMYSLLLLLLIIFLKKYHAGEVGVGTATVLFGLVLVLAIAFDVITNGPTSEGVGLGSLDARATSWSRTGFKLLLFDLPMAVIVFFGWAVGESYARERWGERLASFDAILRRDPVNATTGRSVLRGVLLGPAVAAAALLVGLIPVLLNVAHPSIGGGTALAVIYGGPSAVFFNASMDAILASVVAILFLLAYANRFRYLWLGVAVAIIFGAITNIGEVPIEPYVWRVLFGFGATAATVVVFLAYDLLTADIALFSGIMFVCLMPVVSVARGHEFSALLSYITIPNAVLLAFSAIALLTKREVIYTYEDLAPHVKRIVERERVKAEIDAANRIQAALLPLDTPNLAGASVASHYRAATEIGGDYFDFLLQPGGEIGIAFGDVSGHGLTSGIVMAMAKSALLVQLDHDSSPRGVMNVLNEIVIKTAPKRILMTFFFGLLDPRSQTLRFSSAGHLDPYVYRADPRRLEPLSSWGFPLGVRRREPFREHTVEFAAGDRLILYSDGLIEAVDDDGEPFGFDRFEKTLMENGHLTADEIKKALLSSVRKFTRNRPPEDDQTLVVVSFDEAVSDFAPRRAVAAAFSESVN